MHSIPALKATKSVTYKSRQLMITCAQQSQCCRRTTKPATQNNEYVQKRHVQKPAVDDHLCTAESVLQEGPQKLLPKTIFCRYLQNGHPVPKMSKQHEAVQEGEQQDGLHLGIVHVHHDVGQHQRHCCQVRSTKNHDLLRCQRRQSDRIFRVCRVKVVQGVHEPAQRSKEQQPRAQQHVTGHRRAHGGSGNQVEQQYGHHECLVPQPKGRVAHQPSVLCNEFFLYTFFVTLGWNDGKPIKVST